MNGECIVNARMKKNVKWKNLVHSECIPIKTQFSTQFEITTTKRKYLFKIHYGVRCTLSIWCFTQNHLQTLKFVVCISTGCRGGDICLMLDLDLANFSIRSKWWMKYKKRVFQTTHTVHTDYCGNGFGYIG